MSEVLVQLGDAVVDLVAHEVRRADGKAGLSTNEVALLQHLLRQDGAPVSRQQLHQDVFGYAPQVVSRAADFAVHRLRPKIEADPSAPAHLLTVPGVGFRLVVDASASAAAPPAEEPGRNNLPADTTSFLGRDQEQADVLELLDGPVRLVTIVGPAGVGKTRLSRRVGAAWLQDHSAAVAFCDLSLVRDKPALLGAVAASVGFGGALGARPQERVAGVFGAAPLLLILDNVEQVVAPVAEAVQAWLQAAPHLQLLLTSRERLRMPGEHIYELSPLGDTEGAELFVERARMARASFRVDSEGDWQVVQRLVRHLDGLPLAIELAAARSPVLSPQQMLDRMMRTAGLERAPRDVPDRQVTLEQAFAWSWDLLCPEDRSILSQLTAFRGPFDIDDAEAVVALPTGAGSVVERVQALREKSLLVEVSSDGPPHFALLGAVRDFAEARCADQEGTWRRHAEWVVAATREPGRRHLLGDSPSTGALELHHRNLVVAIDRLAQLADSPRLLVEAVTAAHATWRRSGTRDGYLGRVEQALASGAAASAAARIWLHLARASFLQPEGGGSLAETSCAEVLALAGDGQGRPEVAAARLLLASFRHRQHRFEEAWQALGEARTELAGASTGALHVKLEIQSGNLCIEQKRFDDANGYFRRALAQAERAEAPWFEPLVYNNLAVLRGWEDKADEQAAMARRALMRARTLGLRVDERRALLMLTVAESEVGRLDDAAKHGADAVALSEADHEPSLACDARVALAGIEFARGDLEAVQGHVRAARRLQSFARAPWHRAYIDLWDALGGWARWGSLEDAVELLTRASDLARGHMPHGELLIASKLLAARAHLEPGAADEIDAALLDVAADARAQGREELARAASVDRAHVALARAERAIAEGADPGMHLAPVRAELRRGGSQDVASDGLATVWSRVLLASAYAELEQAGPDGVVVAGARG